MSRISSSIASASDMAFRLSRARGALTPCLKSIGRYQSARHFILSATAREAAVPAKLSEETKLREEEQPKALGQAPNRNGVWSLSQNPRSQAMTGPRFEQTDFDLQPQPLSAMEMIHSQPVRWTHSRVVACDGGGGAAGHPKIFINTDKPEIAVCNYCGLPFANEHNRKHIESLEETSYPLS